jgi:hypothetical protein
VVNVKQKDDHVADGEIRSPWADVARWPVNVLGRQWNSAMKQAGWRRAASVARIGIELVVAIVVVFVIIVI